jgi:hypothetical protein
MWRESVVSVFNTYQYGMRSQKGHHLTLEDRKLCSYILGEARAMDLSLST